MSAAMAVHMKSTIMPTMRYRDAPGMIEWLGKVFGFEKHAVYTTPEGLVAHAQLTLGGGMLMLGSQRDDDYGCHFKSPGELGLETRSVYIVVSDVDAVYARAQEAGAVMVRPLQNTDYGSREFSVKDLEGYSWSVGTYDPWVTHPETA